MRISRVLWVLLCLSGSVLSQENSTEQWQVDRPAGVFSKANIDVTEGTWMNLTLHPDGQWLVFDLLGDLYKLPISGGEAVPITSGISWDMQPQFSPDGKLLAFTSDRDGGDNIWLMEWPNGALHQVTKETFRLVNSPAWSADSQYLVVRKHFTGARSLGAGEIWQYHVRGGSGLQLTERLNDQKDLGEPAFGPDNRYIYFSHDDTPGKTFHYSRDALKGIYTLKRFDRHTGETEVLIKRSGGAVRPTPSPDGRYLAFVGRDDFDTVLYLYDLVSGHITELYRDLDRDMQETWAIHGVYPTMAWSPDATTLYFWAGGQIHTLNLDTKALGLVPFRVADSRQIQQALSFKQPSPSSQFSINMMRFAQISPSGYHLVFEALGKLWSKELPYGKAEPIIELEDSFVLYPQWSRDGRKLVYVSWNDRYQGAVRVYDKASKTETVLTAKPGKYIEPTFSPDGTYVVFRQTAGDVTLPRDWSRDTGIYRVRVDGSDQPQRIAKQGFAPQFGADSERVYLTELIDDKPTLVSVNLQGFDRREHYRNQHASEYKLSPDGKLLAFAERFKVFVTPFTQTGQVIELGPETTALPVTQLSKRAGENLSWTADSKLLYWTLGAELYSQSVDDLFALHSPSDQMDLLSLTQNGHYIGLMSDRDRPDTRVAFTHARIITMEGDQVIEDGTLIVEGDRIKALGNSSEISLDDDIEQIDLAGKTLMPGFIDAHAHASQGSDEIIPQQNWVNYATLALGVTTIHDPSNDTSTFFAASELQKAGKIVAPRLYSTGTILYGANIPGYTAHIDSYEDALFHVERLKKAGAFSIKSYNQPRRNQRQQLIHAARQRNMLVMPEGGSLLQHNLTMIVDGHTTIEHSLPVETLYDDVLQLMSQSGTAYTPTLVVAYGGIWGENYWYANSNVWLHPLLSKYVPKQILYSRAIRVPQAPEHHYNHFNVAREAKKLNDLGVLTNIGGHGQREGLGAHWEIWMFTQGGMPPLQALKTATINPAITLGLDADLGSLKVGKLADMIVIDGNPLEDIRLTDQLVYVMVNGRLYESSSMNQILPQPLERQRFYFE